MADENTTIDEFAEEILSFFPRIYYPFRRLLGEYSEFQITTLQILELAYLLLLNHIMRPEIFATVLLVSIFHKKSIESLRIFYLSNWVFAKRRAQNEYFLLIFIYPTMSTP